MIEVAELSVPSEVLHVAERQATRFIASGDRRKRPVVEERPDPEASKVYQVYAVDPQQPLKQGDIVGLSPTGWRMVLLSKDGEVVASSEVRNKGDGFAPSGFVTGPPSLNQLFHGLSEKQSELTGRFEARFFEAPSLHVRSLWLHGSTDVFIVAGTGKTTLASESEMLGVVNRVFERKVSSRDPRLYREP